MSSTKDDLITIANKLLIKNNLEATSYHILQQLWSGYGTIARVKAESIASTQQSSTVSLILKHVKPPSDAQGDEGHLRKLISYQVEHYFYTALAPSMPKDIAVAQSLAQARNVNSLSMVLSDLRELYPVACEKRGGLDQTQTYAALNWLAKFHGFWWQRTGELKAEGLRLPPLEESGSSQKQGVWLNGGYTYLATRRSEYASLQSDQRSEWSRKLCDPYRGLTVSVAEIVADMLSPSASSRSPIAEFETLIHGDVKSENLFARPEGNAVAFFDFQYVGLGLGMCDLAKLFTCSVPPELLGDQNDASRDMAAGERTLLKHYQKTIEEASRKAYPWEVLEMHWKTALVDWLRFQASWGFWGNTDWLEGRVRCILADEEWQTWLLETANVAKDEKNSLNSK